MAKQFQLSARVSSDDPPAIHPALKAFVGARGTLKKLEDGFEVTATVEGASARDLNRALLSELRRAVRKTRLRAEWTAGGVVEKFFDYVPKGIRKLPAGGK